MATLPSDTALGGLPSASASRPIASVDTTPIDTGVEQLGQGVSNLAQGVNTYVTTQQRAADTLGEAQATAAFTSGKLNLDDQRDNETDPAAISAYAPKYKQNLTDAAALIPDPAQRQNFIIRNSPQVTQSVIATSDKSDGQQKDIDLATADQTFNTIIQNAPRTDPAMRAQAIDTINSTIDGLANDGRITRQQAVQWKVAYAQKYATTSLNALPPDQRIAALTGDVSKNAAAGQAMTFFQQQGWTPAQASGIVGGLLYESGGKLDPNAVKPGDGQDGSDSIGIGQWNGARAQALKDFAAAQGKPWNDLGTQIAFAQHELQTSEIGAATALKGAETPMQAAEAALKYERPKGFEGGLPTALGGAQRLGYAQRLMSAYGGDGSTAPAPPAGAQMAELIDPNARIDMLNQSTREWTQQTRAQQQATATERANVTQLIKDDQTSLVTTGTPLDGLTPERVGAALGTQAQQDFLANRQMAQQFHDATYDWDTIPQDQIEARVATLKPQPGSANFDTAQQYYTLAQKTAASVIKKRDDDPAGSVDALPQIVNLKSQVDPNTPGSFLPVVKARMAAQTQIGIAPLAQSPITKTEINGYTSQMMPLTRGQANVYAQNDLIDKVIGQVKTQYGPYAPQAMTQILSNISLAPEASYAVAAAVQRLAPQAAAAPPDPALSPPTGVDPGRWQTVLNQRPLDQSGQPIPAAEWATFMHRLVANPTPQEIGLFNASRFGKKGFDGNQILNQLAGQ